MVELILQTHYDTVQYETTDNLLSEVEFEALCSSHAACRQLVETALIQDEKLQIATRDDDKKVVHTYNKSSVSTLFLLLLRYINWLRGILNRRKKKFHLLIREF